MALRTQGSEISRSTANALRVGQVTRYRKITRMAIDGAFACRLDHVIHEPAVRPISRHIEQAGINGRSAECYANRQRGQRPHQKTFHLVSPLKPRKKTAENGFIGGDNSLYTPRRRI